MADQPELTDADLDQVVGGTAASQVLIDRLLAAGDPRSLYIAGMYQQGMSLEQVTAVLAQNNAARAHGGM